MTRLLRLARWLLPLALCHWTAAAEPKARSGILDRAPFELPAFEQLPKAPFGALSAAAYGKVLEVGRGRLERIAYLSGGIKVFALVLPAAGPPTRAPVIVYCRGGVGPGAAIGLANPFPLYEMSRYAEAGFFVIAPQYRGNDGAGGRDEVGGAEVADILALADLLKAFPQADPSRRFLVGSSRGSMNALQAVRAGFEAKGVVVNGLPADWDLAFARNDRLRGVANDFWPDFKTDAAGAVARRSAARWATAISVPVLIQHGGADTIIHPSVALDFANKLTEAGKPYDFVIYANDDHPISNRADERLARTVDWMRAHAPAPVPVVAEDFKLTIPAQLGAGFNEFAFENRGREPHYFRFMRLEDGKSIGDFLEWRKSRTAPPGWLVASGGGGTLAPGERATYATNLPAGKYVAFCGHPSPDGVQHVDKGMYAEVTVSGEEHAVTRPIPDVEIELGDGHLALTPAFHAGRQIAHLRNTGTHAHQALLVQLPAGVTAESELEWFRNGSRGVRPGHPMGGVIELAAGGEAWAGFDLGPGRYVILCAIAGPDGQRHFDHGMLQAFEIRPSGN